MLKINTQILDREGCFILLDCIIKETNYILVNLYAPTIDKTSDQDNFGAYIWNTIEDYMGCNIVIGSDFNINIESLEIKIRIPQDHSYNSYL